MTVDEWGVAALLLLRRWPGQNLDSDVLDTWGELLMDLPGPAVCAAVRAIALTEREFVPNPGVIRARVADLDQPQVTFEQAWAEVDRAISAAGLYRPALAESMLRQVPGAWDLVLAMGGWAEICNGAPIEQPPMPAGVRRAAAEHAWKALQEQRRTDVAATPLPGPAGDVARQRRATGGMQRIAIPPLPGPADPALPPPAMANRSAVLALASTDAERASANARLKPEYRAELERLIRAGQEAQIPARWQRYVAELRAAMELPA